MALKNPQGLETLSSALLLVPPCKLLRLILPKPLLHLQATFFLLALPLFIQEEARNVELNPSDPEDAHAENSEDPDDPDPNNEDDGFIDPNAAAPQLDQSLAQSLRLLASKIGTISTPLKSKSKVQQRVPDTFNGTDPSKLDTFTFQCGLYISACSSNFPDDEDCITFVLSYLKGVPLMTYMVI